MGERSEMYWAITGAAGLPAGNGLLVLVAVLAGVIAGIVTFELAKAGDRVPAAIIKSGVAFGATVTLALLVIDALRT